MLFQLTSSLSKTADCTRGGLPAAPAEFAVRCRRMRIPPIRVAANARSPSHAQPALRPAHVPNVRMATALCHLCGAAAVGPSDTSAESSSALMFDPDTTQTTFRPSTSATFAAISAATAAAPDASTTCAARRDRSPRAQQCGRGYQRSMPGEHAGGASPTYQTKGKKRAHCSTQLIVAHEDDAVRKRAHMLVAQLHRCAHARRAAKRSEGSAQRLLVRSVWAVGVEGRSAHVRQRVAPDHARSSAPTCHGSIQATRQAEIGFSLAQAWQQCIPYHTQSCRATG